MATNAEFTPDLQSDTGWAGDGQRPITTRCWCDWKIPDIPGDRNYRSILVLAHRIEHLEGRYDEQS